MYRMKGKTQTPIKKTIKKTTSNTKQKKNFTLPKNKRQNKTG